MKGGWEPWDCAACDCSEEECLQCEDIDQQPPCVFPATGACCITAPGSPPQCIGNQVTEEHCNVQGGEWCGCNVSCQECGC